MLTTSGRTDAQVAVAAARAGASVVRDLYGGSPERFDKGAGDFATAADLAAEQAILEVLRILRPDDAVTGEESGATGAADAGRRWLVDPLCGTLNYAVHTMLVGVNVALREGGRVVAAATADPFADEVYWSGTGRAHVLARDGAETGLTPSAGSRLVDLNLDPPFPNAPGFLAARLLTDPAFTARFRPRVVSTTLAVAWVAAGRRAAYVTDGDLRDSVHFSAGIALCEAAGCVVTGLDGRPPCTGANGLIAAADHETHAALLAMTRNRTDT
ncbi:inositol monophosphatase family protein [Streptomyces sp. UH6]|uniref:inositol monophosphatase family protein n=1 Tax=Streptomyces sp. UH6 TaxID=2748379 RepID=UPI0015D4A4A2|nr:inositol monophosphatase family protein [Streptomyces sp. UH6]NYV73345.1 inositol monophosphatase family protein [Streptomyces sp. UH6]